MYTLDGSGVADYYILSKSEKELQKILIVCPRRKSKSSIDMPTGHLLLEAV